VHRTSKHAVLRLVIAMTVAAAISIAWAGTALAAGAPTGTLEVCKSSLNGMSGRTFVFTYQIKGGSPSTPFSVRGGRCSGPISVPAGEYTLLEQNDPVGSAATEVASIRATPSARLLSTDLASRKVVVSVPAGTSAANETRVTYVNQPAGGNFGDLKICKLTETPSFIGRDFSFKVNGGSAISVTAAEAFDDPSTWSCRLAGHFQVGSVVSIQELTPPEAEVAWVDTDPANAYVSSDTNAGTATVQIGAGMTVVEFDNEAHTPQGNGYLEICKDRAQLGYHDVDWAVQGPFTFTVEDASETLQDVTVLAGQCSAPLQIAAGIAHVTEHAVAGIDLVDAYTIPEDRLMGVNLINKTADVEVPVSSDPNDETQLHMVNQAQRAQLKICKALGPGSSDLVGQKFYFDVDAGHGMWLDGNRYPFSITAGAQTQCKIWGDLPIGTDVSVDELFAEDYQQVQALTPLKLIELPSNAFIDTTGEGTLTVKPGINTITITNQAMGQLEVCKAKIKDLNTNAQPYIQFTVDGKKIPLVRAGKCSMPLRVTVGNHTVVETSYTKAASSSPYGPYGSAITLGSSASDYELDTGGTFFGIPYTTPGGGIDVQPSDRLVAKNTNTRSVTVFVPYGVNGETLVTYYNRIRRGQIKICKTIPDTSSDSLGGKTFDFKWTVDHQGGSVSLKPGECSFVLGESNIIDSNAQPTQVFVQEQGGPFPNGSWLIDGIAVQFARDNVQTSFTTGIATWNLGPNTNVVTYDNKSVDP
jgi:hypothetical protein